MNIIIIIGLAAGFLTTIAFLPQAIKTWRTRTTEDVSLSTFVIQLAANIFWVVYGSLIREIPLILWNSVTAALVFIIVLFILKYGKQKANISVMILIPAAIVVLCILAAVLRIEAIGYLATFFGLSAFLPQAIKTWRTKATKDISLGMYAIFWLGVLLWLAYGVLLKNPPVVIVNVVVLSLSSMILFLKVKHG